MADIARSMRLRMPWPVGQLILEENDVPRGRGWENTVAKLSNSRIDFSDDIAPLTECVREHLLCGEKACSFYRLTATDRAELQARIEDAEIPVTASSECYPLLLSPASLEAEPAAQVLIATERTNKGVVAVFSSVRTVTTRETLTEADLPDDAANVLHSFDELIGIKHARIQALDIVFIPDKGRFVDLRIDCPQGMNAVQVEFARKQLVRTVEQQLGIALCEPENLFPLIYALYAQRGEGSVVELAFGTTTASLKHEKMRRKGHDLREEIYHQAGKAALVTQIEPYRVSIVWKRKVSTNKYSRPELSLFSDSRSAASDAPQLVTALIARCVGSDDYHFVRGKLANALVELHEQVNV